MFVDSVFSVWHKKAFARSLTRVFVRPCRTGKNHPPTRIRTRDLKISTQSTVLRFTNSAIGGCYIVLQSVLACLLILSFPFDIKKAFARSLTRVFVRPCRTGKNHPPTRIRTRDLRISTQSTVLRSTNWAIGGCYIVLQSVLACLLIVSFPFRHKKSFEWSQTSFCTSVPNWWKSSADRDSNQGPKDLYAVYSPPLYQLSYRRLLYRPAKCFSMFVDCVFSVLT